MVHTSLFLQAAAVLIQQSQRRLPSDTQAHHEFLTGRRAIAKASKHPARHHSGPVLMDAARGHASVRRLDDDGDPFRPQHLLDDVRYLSSKPFLYLQSAGTLAGRRQSDFNSLQPAPARAQQRKFLIWLKDGAKRSL